MIFENVLGLKNPPKDDPSGPSNLDIFGLLLSGLGYRLHAWHFSPRMLGFLTAAKKVDDSNSDKQDGGRDGGLFGEL